MSFLDKGRGGASRRSVVIICAIAFLLIFFTYNYRKSSSGPEPWWKASNSYATANYDDSNPSKNQKPHDPDDPNTHTSHSISVDEEHSTELSAKQQDNSKYTTTIVLGRLDKDEEKVKWVESELGNITTKAIYIVDDPKAALHLDKNHGREAMVYLKYIIDNYDNLNDITFFWHSDLKVWHNNILLGEDSAKTINMMNRDVIMRKGYVNSRCDHWPGCPSWITFNPSAAEHRLDHHKLSDMFSEKTFKELFPDEEDFPRYFAETCCSQFAVSRDTIRAQPIETYKRIRDWIDAWWSDQFTGRALEMMWQYIFLRKGAVCPTMQDCYCETYGLCIENRKEISLIDRWNELRTRGEELQWQQWFRSNEWVELGLDKDSDKNIDEDEEHMRLTKEMEDIKLKSREYKDMILKHWNLPSSEVDW